PSTTGPAWRWRCAISRSPIFRSATRASISPTAGTICEARMLKVLLARARQGQRTAPYPDQPPALPDRFRGLPVLDPSRCADGCRACAEACPTGAITADGGLKLDLGRCLFCPECVQACPEGAIAFTADHRLAARTRRDLVLTGPQQYPRAAALEERLRSLFGRSLKLRVVSAGDCNACASDVNVLGTPVF